MLNLTRYIGERIYINDNIEITVLRINGKQVMFGFEAPKEISIHREEIYKKIKAQEQCLQVVNGDC